MTQYISEAIQKGYESGTSIAEDISSKDTLKKAYEQVGSTKEFDEQTGETKPVDMFKVNQLAAQMAAKRGDERIADKFEKRAQETKKNEYANQLEEMKVDQQKLEKFEQDVHLVNTPDQALEMAMSSKLPTQQKMAIINQIKQVGNDPEKFNALKDKLQDSVLSAKERLTAAQKTLQMKQKHEEKLGDQAIKLEGIRTQAQLKQLMINLGYDKLDETKRHNIAGENLKQSSELNKIDTETEKNIIKATKGKDPEEAKVIGNRMRKQAEARKESLMKKQTGKIAKDTDISEAHINKLIENRQNPQALKDFDAKYGAGMAKVVLGNALQGKEDDAEKE